MHKYLLDENISSKLVDGLLPLYKFVKHVKELNLINFTDIEIWNFARLNGYSIITKDNDFLHLSNFHRCPPKVIRL